MPDIRRVLCPVDRSEPSARALGYAAAVASRHGASLLVVEVVDLPVAGLVGPSNAGWRPDDAFRASVLASLETFAEQARLAGVAVETRVVEGPVVREIVAMAGELPADLVVVGTHGRSGVERFLLGSVAERLLQHADWPVLTVPPGAAAPGAPPFTRVLCATDFSEASDAAFDHALFHARSSRGEVIAAHVLEWPLGPVAGGDDAVSQLYRSLEDEARSELVKLVDRATAAGVPCQMVIETGRPRHQVSAIAAARGADLICVGVTGRGAVPAALLGSTTSQVVRSAPCPVLTIPRPTPGPAAPA